MACQQSVALTRPVRSSYVVLLSLAALFCVTFLSACGPAANFNDLANSDDANSDNKFIVAVEADPLYRTLFVMGDTDADGKLSEDEFQAVVDQLKPDGVNRALVMGTGDGKLTEDEAKAVIRKLEKGFSNRVIVGQLIQLGDNGDGKLTEDEFKLAVEKLPTPLYISLPIFLAVVALPFFFGGKIASALRMEDYGFKIGLVLFSIVAASVIIYVQRDAVKFGIDLSGGVILIYEIDEEKTNEQAGVDEEGQPLTEGEKVKIGDLVTMLQRRLNPGGVKEIVIRPYGERQVEIIIPQVDAAEVELIKRSVSKSGLLEFFIIASEARQPEVIDAAKLNPRLTVVKNEAGKTIGRWVKVGKPDNSNLGAVDRFLGISGGDTLRNSKTKQIVTYGEVASPNSPIESVDVLVRVDSVPEYNIKGSHLRSSSAGTNSEDMSPCIFFSMDGLGAKLMGALTGDHMPDKNRGIYSRLGIVMDGELLSAPTLQARISSRGQITGSFTQEEVEFLVGILRAGKLPAVLHEVPISENTISPLLGEDTIAKGKFAISISLVAVLVFMVLYYRFAGIIACLALLSNLVLIVGMMILIKAAFTLPGLAGLVLTVGMSVDANVLIFERMREERRKGSALRMAIRNGFGRATTTIVDANLTTLITALVLYSIGTDQIRGFAVTLILGILMSMYTAIFCSRIIFDIAERRSWIKDLSMAQALGETNFNFMGKRKITSSISGVLIIVGLFAVFSRGKQLFDIDFNGGTSAQMMLVDESNVAAVRAKLEADEVIGAYDPTVTEVTIDGITPGTVWKIDTSITGEEDEFAIKNDAGEKIGDGDGVAIVQERLISAFSDDGFSLVHYEMEIGPVEAVEQETEPATDGSDTIDDKQSRVDIPMTPADRNALLVSGSLFGLPQEEAGQESSADEPVDDEPVDEEPVADEPVADEPVADEPVTDEPAADATAEETTPDGTPSLSAVDISYSQVELKFGDRKINAQTLGGLIIEAAEELGIDLIEEPLLTADGYDGASSTAFKKWKLQLAISTEDTTILLESIQNKLVNMPVWPSSSKVGGKVAGKMQSMAIAALLTSLLGIVAYIWIRFQGVIFGLAAVVALVHDVLITLGAIAVSAYVAGVLGFLQIEEFKISLPVVAAFLTIIGYSLNDTIVVFDRVREVRGKSKELSQAMINKSINQTLSRTLLTSVTTLIVVLILYFFGGQGIHSFAFALVIGVMVGTYSSVFVASPVLLWMNDRGE